MKIVVKIGGAALDDKALLSPAVHAIAELASSGHRVAVVHGGGAALTRTLAQMGKKSEFINGLRVTDPETRDVAIMVLGGRINKALVAALIAAGQPAIGLCGGDGAAFRARKKAVPGLDLGFVGEISATETRWLEAIWSIGGVPVIASLALGSDGEYYNVNADQMAAACAVACHVDLLVFLTDVAGVKDAAGDVLPRISVPQADALQRQAVIHGGMLPKMEACRHALRWGVGRVRILPAARAEVLPDFGCTKIEFGTEVMLA